MKKFRNRIGLLVVAPAYPLVALAFVIRGEDCWWEPLVVWCRDFVNGD